MNDKKTIIDEILCCISNDVKEIKQIKKIILFGSYAYGTPNQNSDIDLCFIVEDSYLNGTTKNDFYAECAAVVGKYCIEHKIEYDIVICTSSKIETPPNGMYEQISNEGKTIYER